MIREAIAAVTARKDLTEAEAAEVTDEIMRDKATPSQIGAFLTALRMKGETVDEITGMARTMRANALRVEVEGDLLDVVSTGGGAFDPLNISTAAALVCAGAGARVAKHGNRGFTSASGAADVLEALGAKIDLAPEQVKQLHRGDGLRLPVRTDLPPGDAFRRADAPRDRHPHHLQRTGPADEPRRRAVPAPRRRRRHPGAEDRRGDRAPRDRQDARRAQR